MNNEILEIMPELAKILQEETTPNSNIEIFPAKDGHLTAKISGKLVHSLYRPYEEAERQLAKLEIKDKKFIILIGAGLGYIVECLLRKKEQSQKIYVVEENKEFIEHILKNKDIYLAIKNKEVYLYHISQKKKFMYDVEKNFQLGVAPEYEIIINNVCYEQNESEYIKFLNILKDLISNNLVGTSTIFEFSKMWQKNSFRNLRYFAEAIGVNKLYNKFKNIPVIIVAAGPSLDKNIKYLKWVKNKAIVIVVGTALKKVLMEGIEPDFIIGIDGGEPNWEHFRRCEYEDFPLIFEPMVNPKIVTNQRGEKIVFVADNIVGAWAEHILGEKGFVKMGGSVAISAYDFGVKIGGNPVILLGQDLAFSGGKSHTSGSVYEKDKIEKDENDIHQLEVEDIYGGKILTDRKLYTFLQYFERFISMDHEENFDLKVIDATEGGAKIQGTEVMLFKDVYHKYIINSFVNVKEELNKISENINKDENIKLLISEKEKLKLKLEETYKNVSAGIKILNQILNKRDFSKVNELNKIEEKINKYPEVNHLIKYITQPIISKIFRETKNNNSKEEIFKLNLELYEGIKSGIEFNIKCLEEVDGSYLNS